MKRHTVIPLLLAVYLAVMAWIGLDGLRSGQTSTLQYAATLIVSAAVIVALHFFLKKRDALRRARRDDSPDDKKQNSI